MRPEEPHEMLLRDDFSSPVEFITAYTVSYDMQACTPYKTFPKDIPYLKQFDMVFLDHLFQYIMENTENPEGLEKYLFYIEDTVTACKGKRFSDTEFYELCTLIYVKALVFMVDQCEFKLLSYDMDSNEKVLASYYMLLYKFSSLKLDVNNLLLKQVMSSTSIGEALKKVQGFMNSVNKLVEEGCRTTLFKDDTRYIERLNVSPEILGETRVEHYSFEHFLEKVVKMLVDSTQNMTNEERYIKMINFASEIELRSLGSEEVHSRVRKVAREMINS